MGKIILILFAFIVLVIVAFSFVLGFFRRLFGIALRNTFTATPQAQKTSAQSTDKVLYHDSTTEVLQGEHAPPQRPKSTVVRDASFSNKTTGTSPSPKN